MNIKKYLKKRYQIVIQYLGFGEQEVYYIGGSEKLPPPLSKKEEIELLNKLKENDDEARKIFNKRNSITIVAAPTGEGKTTTTIGLADGLRKIGKNVMVALREPSLGPVFGVKGGAAGGG